MFERTKNAVEQEPQASVSTDFFEFSQTFASVYFNSRSFANTEWMLKRVSPWYRIGSNVAINSSNVSFFSCTLFSCVFFNYFEVIRTPLAVNKKLRKTKGVAHLTTSHYLSPEEEKRILGEDHLIFRITEERSVITERPKEGGGGGLLYVTYPYRLMWWTAIFAL